MSPVGSWKDALSPVELKTAQEKLEEFSRLLTRWNRSIKMIAMNESLETHILDSVAVVPHLGGVARLIDVGTGGGFPGAVLAIVRPGVEVTSLEPIHKKHAFLATVRRELELLNFRPLAERDDQHAQRSEFMPYDAAVSRATFAVSIWLERGLRLIKSGGLVVAMEGRDVNVLPSGTVRVPYPLADRNRSLLLRRLPDDRSTGS